MRAPTHTDILTHTHTHIIHLYSAYKEFLCRIQFLSRSNKHVCLNARTRTSTHTHAHSDLRDIFGVYACCTVSFIYARLHTSTPDICILDQTNMHQRLSARTHAHQLVFDVCLAPISAYP